MGFKKRRFIESTRKEHKCIECNKVIKKGSEALYAVGRNDLTGFYSYYACVPCVREKHIN